MASATRSSTSSSLPLDTDDESEQVSTVAAVHRSLSQIVGLNYKSGDQDRVYLPSHMDIHRCKRIGRSRLI